MVHYFAFLFSLIKFVYRVLTLRRMYRALGWWVVAQGLAFLLFLPWAVAVSIRDGRDFGLSWIQPSTFLDLPITSFGCALALGEPAWLLTWARLDLALSPAVRL